MIYTADYTCNAEGRWVARLRPHDTPDTTIDTREHEDFLACAGEVFDLVEPDAVVELGDVTGDP